MKIAKLFFAAAALAGPAAAENIDLAAAFGARPGVERASLSPDGKRIALIAPGTGRTSVLYTLDVAENAEPKRILTSSGAPESLRTCNWVATDRLACLASGLTDLEGRLVSFSSVVGVDAAGGNQKLLSQRRGENALWLDLRGGSVIDLLPDENGTVLMTRSYVPEERLGTLVQKQLRGLGVDRVNSRSGAAERIENPRADAVEYISDGRGTVRILGLQVASDAGYTQGAIRYLYRSAGSANWAPLSVYDYRKRTGFNPYAVDPDKNLAYGFETVDGRQALVSLSLDGKTTKQVVYARDEVDVDGLVRIGRRQRVVGLSYATDRRYSVYFDPTVKGVVGSLEKAIGGGKSVQIIDASTDENRLLIWAGSDVDPGQYYLFDRTAKTLSPVIAERPQLAGVTLAQVKAVRYPAADGTMVPAYLTTPPGKEAKGLPAIVLPHGGPSARDEWGFDWLSQYFVARGFAVIQPNFRGSAGYGDAWFQQNGFRSWRTAVGDVADAGKWLVAQGIADPAKLTVLGWSYGGYAALQAAVIEPDLFKAVVAVAPVTDLGTLIENSRDYSDFRDVRDYIGTGPHLVEGSPARNAARIKAPVLMFQGTRDANVPQRQARLMDSKLKEAGKRSELVIFDGLEHSLVDSEARKTLLQRSGDFLLAAGK